MGADEIFVATVYWVMLRKETRDRYCRLWLDCMRCLPDLGSVDVVDPGVVRCTAVAASSGALV